MIHPYEDYIINLGKENGLGGNYAELCGNKKIEDLVLAEINKTAKSAKLAGFETPRGLYLEPVSFMDLDVIVKSTLKL